jgi:uncharacterized protein (DUF488 family)
MHIYTIGFTRKTARDFFESLQGVQARYLLDVRVHNNSQLAGFSKRDHLEYFAHRLTRLTYLECPLLVPGEAQFKQYGCNRDWSAYEAKYLALLDSRRASEEMDPGVFVDGVVLLCAEPTPERCHRRLAAEYLQAHLFPEAQIVHI